MSYGHGNQQRLRYIVDHLHEYVVGNIIAHKKPLGRAYRTQSSQFSPALQLAITRGEALLVQLFFEWCEDMNFCFNAPDKALWLYAQLIENKGRIIDLTHRIKLHGAIGAQTALPQSLLPDSQRKLSFQLYCGLIDDLQQNNEHRLLKIATHRFFSFSFRGLFPNQISSPVKKNNPEAMRAKAMNQLRKQLKQPFKLKEHFHIAKNEANHPVIFRLCLQQDNGKSHLFPKHYGKRLKPLRLNAYEALLNLIQSSTLKTLL